MCVCWPNLQGTSKNNCVVVCSNTNKNSPVARFYSFPVKRRVGVTAAMDRHCLVGNFLFPCFFFFLLLGVCALDVYMDARQSWSQCTHVLVEFVRRAAYGLKAFCLGSKCYLPLWHVVCGCWGLQAPILLVFCNLLHHCTSSHAVHVMCWFVHVELLLVASCRTWFFKHQVFASLCKAKSCCILSKWLQTNTFLTAWFFLPEYIVDVGVTWKML